MGLKKCNVKTKEKLHGGKEDKYAGGQVNGGGKVGDEYERKLMKEKLGIWRVSKRRKFERKTIVSCCKGKKEMENCQWVIIIVAIIVNFLKNCFTGDRNLEDLGHIFHSERHKI